MEFKPYEAKPITRMAFQITEDHCLIKDLHKESNYLICDPHNPRNLINFKAYQDPQVGDWVVRLTEEDTYHCTDAVFRERNIVPE